MSRVSYSNRRSGVTQVDGKPQDSLNLFSSPTDTTTTAPASNSRRSTANRDTLNLFGTADTTPATTTNTDSDSRRTSGRNNIPADQFKLTDQIDPTLANATRPESHVQHKNTFSVANQFDVPEQQPQTNGHSKPVSNTYISNVQLTDTVDPATSTPARPTTGNRSNMSSIKLTSEPDNEPLHTSKGLVDGKHNNHSSISIGADGYMVGNDDSSEHRRHISRSSRGNTSTFNVSELHQEINNVGHTGQVPRHLESHMEKNFSGTANQAESPSHRTGVPKHLQSNVGDVISGAGSNGVAASKVQEEKQAEPSQQQAAQRLSTRVIDRTGGSGGKSSIVFG